MAHDVKLSVPLITESSFGCLAVWENSSDVAVSPQSSQKMILKKLVFFPINKLLCHFKADVEIFFFNYNP